MIVFTAVNLAADVCVVTPWGQESQAVSDSEVLCTWQSSKSKLLEEEAQREKSNDSKRAVAGGFEHEPLWSTCPFGS